MTQVTVVGCGSAGRRHIKNLLDLGCSVVVDDNSESAVRSALESFPGTFADSPAPSDAVVIATPTEYHLSRLERYRDRPCFMEKPLALASEHVAPYLPLPPLLQVGYQLRFDEGIRQLRAELPDNVVSARVFFSQRLTDWQPDRDYRLTPYAKTGILLEASHELDLIRYLFGPWSWVFADVSKQSDLDLDVPDSAAAIIRTADGVTIQLSLDMVASRYERGIDVVCADGRVLRWRYSRYSPETSLSYRAEMDAFLRMVETGVMDPDAATLEDGVQALRLAEAMVRSSQMREIVFNPEAAEVEGDFAAMTGWRI